MNFPVSLSLSRTFQDKAPSFKLDASLLNPFLNLQIPEQGAPGALAQLDPEARADRIVRLMTHLFEVCAEK